MRAVVTRVAGLLALALTLGGCTDGGEAGPTPSGDGPRSSASPTRDPAAVVSAARDATTAARSVVVSRTTRDSSFAAGKTGDDPEFTHEDIEVAFTTPPSARVLHVGDDIWTLDVVDGVGHLKDQSERKSTNRWARLTDAETAAHLRNLTPEGLLRVLDAASSVAAPSDETVRGVPSTCHAFVLDPDRALSLTAGDEDDPESAGPAVPVTASARLCVDSKKRPVETVVTVGERVTTSVFSQWGFAIEAMPPPEDLVDPPDS